MQSNSALSKKYQLALVRTWGNMIDIKNEDGQQGQGHPVPQITIGITTNKGHMSI